MIPTPILESNLDAAPVLKLRLVVTPNKKANCKHSHSQRDSSKQRLFSVGSFERVVSLLS